MISKFKEWSISESLLIHIDNISESGLIAGKYDFSELAEACYFTLEKLNLGKGESRLFILELNSKKILIQYDGTDDNFIASWSERNEKDNESNKYFVSGKEVIIPTSQDLNKIDGALTLTPKFLKMNKISREMVIAHELSHAIDPGVEDIRFKSPERGKRGEELENWHELAYQKIEDGDFSEWYKGYMRRTTEIEAHVGMFIYATNFLLMKYPNKIEEVKDLLRKGDWGIYKVFPELKEITNYVKDRINNFEKVKRKMLQRLGTLVSDIQKPGIKPKFKIKGTLKWNKELRKEILDKFPSCSDGGYD